MNRAAISPHAAERLEFGLRGGDSEIELTMKTWMLWTGRGLALAGLTTIASLNLLAQPAIPDEYKTGGFAIGCQAYTFNRFSVFEAIEKTALAGAKVIEFYPGQKLSKEGPDVRWDHNASDDVIAKVKAKLAEHKIMAVNYGVVDIPKDEATARKIFEFAKKMGMRGITTESTDSIDTIEKLAKEYDLVVGYHNHPRQPNNPNYKVWDPNYIVELTKGRDPRVGACVDTGHWLRSNLNPVECLKILKGRIVSSHLKDLHQKGPGAHDVPFGTGVADIRACLDELAAQGFAGNISIEYEHNWDNSVPEVGQCIGFVRGYGKP
ncbi:MAG TPA: sugar phosphate isomerase/epimerase family protein [Verrucomicrobiota bacterium]|nr:sugar phosphate isomerase/epimerase family protein [Verrucomicrobiota bacterium]